MKTREQGGASQRASMGAVPGAPGVLQPQSLAVPAQEIQEGCVPAAAARQLTSTPWRRRVCLTGRRQRRQDIEQGTEQRFGLLNIPMLNFMRLINIIIFIAIAIDKYYYIYF